MQSEGYNSTAFLSWAKTRELIRTSKLRNHISKRINGVVTNCVAIKLKEEDRKIPPLTDSDLPFM